MTSLVSESKLNNIVNNPVIPFINIMVVDDDRDDAELVLGIIKEISPKYTVICVSQSRQVLETLDAFNYTDLPSLLILDYNMPVLSGLDLLRLLKANPRYAHIPVGVYSNSSFPKFREDCLEAGACIYLSKSATIDGLQDDIKQLLSYCL